MTLLITNPFGIVTLSSVCCLVVSIPALSGFSCWAKTSGRGQLLFVCLFILFSITLLHWESLNGAFNTHYIFWVCPLHSCPSQDWREVRGSRPCWPAWSIHSLLLLIYWTTCSTTFADFQSILVKSPHGLQLPNLLFVPWLGFEEISTVSEFSI